MALLRSQLVNDQLTMQDTPVGFLVGHIPWRRDRLAMPVFLEFPGGSDGKNLPEMQKTWVRSLGWEDPLVMGTPTPVFFPGEFHEQKSLSCYNP